MNRTALHIAVFILTAAGLTAAQRPPQAPPANGGPPRGEGPMRPGQAPMGPDRGGPHGDWFKFVDTNKDEKIDVAEAAAAADALFDDMDKDHSGTLDPSEVRPPRRAVEDRAPRAESDNARRDAEAGPRPGKGHPMLPPFFFMKRVDEGGSITKAQFENAVREAFTEMDKNADGFLTKEEARPPHGPGEGPMAPPPPPNAQFIGAELRFGDKLVEGQPFSAETVVQDNRRLYDGTTVTKEGRGAIYRNTAGRTRREQPLDNVGGFSVVGDNASPQMLVFINDFAANTQYFLDLNNKIARKNDLRSEGRAPRPNGDRRPPRPDGDTPDEAKTESLGTRTIEGVSCEGTRTTFEIPAGQIGNAKPIQVVSERWFSPELQVIVLSRHVDPLAGEHVFKLVNIKRTEPSPDLFAIPARFKIEERHTPRPDDE